MIADPGSPDAAPAERLHPYFILTGLGGSLRGVAGGYAGIGYLAATGRLSTAIYAGVALLVFLVGSLLIYWRRFSFRVGAHEIRIDSGLLNRTHRSIPFDRVQDVDISQGPLARLLGLAKVKFETGAAAAANSDDGVLPAIALNRAQDLRDYVRSRRGVAAPEAVESDTAPLFAMDLKRVVLSGIFGFSLAIFAGLFGATQTLGDVIGFDPLEPGFWRDLLIDSPLASFVLSHQWITGIAGLLVLVAAGFLTGIVRSLLRDFRFRLERTGTGLRRRRGLLTITDVTLPLRRVQAALLLSGPVRERFGWSELKLQSLARDEGGKGDHVVAPLASDEELEPIMQELGWGLPQGPLEPVDRAYAWAAWVPLGAAALLLLVLGIVLQANALIGVVIAAGLAVSRWLCWRRTGFRVDQARLQLRSGWWRRRTVILPLRNVQSVDLTENALGRLFGVATLVIGVAGGSGFSGHRIPALRRKRADEVRAELLSRFA